MFNMTIRSMTGFGRGAAEHGLRSWTVELRSVNNRFLDVKLKLPKSYLSLEDKVRKLVGEYHLRGRVDLAVTVTGDFSDLLNLRVNTELAKSYQNALGELADSLNIDSPLSASQLAAYPDVLIREQSEEDMEAIWPHVEAAVKEALQNCSVMRQDEGNALAGDLTMRLDSFSARVAEIEQAVPEILSLREKNLKERLDKLLDGVELDPLRLAQEVAILADKTDVTEEIVRLQSHIQQFRTFLSEDKGVGRKLDFLIQEFLREVNTIASKINNAETAHLTVELKSELEKMREQVQNIE